MRSGVVITIFLLTLGVGAGCSSHSKTVTTSETRAQPNSSDGTVVERKTETTSESHDDSGGVLSSTVDVVGDVLSWPFRAVGGLLRGIF